MCLSLPLSCLSLSFCHVLFLQWILKAGERFQTGQEQRNKILMLGLHPSGCTEGHVGARRAILGPLWPLELAEPWGNGAPSCLMRWSVKKDQNAEEKRARASEGNLGPQNPGAAGPASWPWLMRPGEGDDSPISPRWRAWPVLRLAQLSANKENPEPGSCTVRKAFSALLGHLVR